MIRPLRINRTAWGVMTGVICWFLVLLRDPNDGDLLGMFAFWPGFLLWFVTIPALAIAERFDFIALPYRNSPLGLSAALREVPFPPKDRGGRRWTLGLWPTQFVAAHHPLVLDFMRRVGEVDPSRYYVTDGLTLWDLHRGPSNQAFFERTRQIYGVDISDIDPPYLWAIAVRIRAQRPQ